MPRIMNRTRAHHRYRKTDEERLAVLPDIFSTNYAGEIWDMNKASARRILLDIEESGRIIAHEDGWQKVGSEFNDGGQNSGR